MKAEDISAKDTLNLTFNKQKDTVLFPKKLLLANESILKSGHPFSPEKKEGKTKIK